MNRVYLTFAAPDPHNTGQTVGPFDDVDAAAKWLTSFLSLGQIKWMIEQRMVIPGVEEPQHNVRARFRAANMIHFGTSDVDQLQEISDAPFQTQE